MRIIGGKFKGKKLSLPADKKTRPLKDLVKESIFNLIKHSNKINLDLEKSKVLDLFSGSGSFGLECLSRCADKIYFFENYPNAINILKKNVSLIDNNNKCKIIDDDCFNYFDSNKKIDVFFDIIFIDPPFKEMRINSLIEKILKKNYLSKNGIIILHRHKKDNIELTKKLNVFDFRTYGISKIYFGS